MKKIFIALAICFSASASFAAQKNEFTAGGFREKEASDKAMRLCRKLGYIDCKYISTRMISGEFEVKVKGTTRQDPSQAGELFTASHYDEQAAYDEAMKAAQYGTDVGLRGLTQATTANQAAGNIGAQEAQYGLQNLQALADNYLSARQMTNTAEIYRLFYEKISIMFDEHDSLFDDPFIESSKIKNT